MAIRAPPPRDPSYGRDQNLEDRVVDLNAEKDFERYLLAEYQNVAQAHFNSIEAVSSFFRYYLILLAIPITLTGFFSVFSSREEILQIISSLRVPVASISFVIALVGFLVLLYLINLRLDVILYARVVNGIRKYFYDQAEIDLSAKLRLRVLPQSPLLPGYGEWRYFLPVVLSFAVFDTFYFAASFAISMSEMPFTELPAVGLPLWALAALVAFFALHLAFYWGYARHREHGYLKSYIVGIDIDGVLNEHRKHFCKLLKEKYVDQTLDPDSITTIPLHEDPTLGVDRSAEVAVFNDPRYWTEMPSLDGASHAIAKLRNQLGLKIHIFTHRAWPREGIRPAKDLYEAWKSAASNMLKDCPQLKVRLAKLRMRRGAGVLRLEPIDVMTRCWLHAKGIQYDSLTIERGSVDVTDPRGKVRNRFYISRKKKIRFFVEDVAENANKLAYICDVVFLLDHPYNQGQKFPGNVKRVHSWDEIYAQIRRLS